MRMRSSRLLFVMLGAFGVSGVVGLGCGTPATPVAPLGTAPSTSGSNVATTPVPSTSATPAVKPWPTPTAVSADTKETLDSGTSFLVPSGFAVGMHGDGALVTGPEPELRLVVLDTTATTPEEAVKQAWNVLHPGFSRTVKLMQGRPGRRGWEEQQIVDYETSPNEKLYLLGRALKKNGRWTAVALESPLALVEKRAGQLRRVTDTLVPPGYARESFAGKKPHELDDARIKSILASADKARELAGIPGEGIALVQNGKISFEGGLGVRALGKPEKVDAHTAFMIASNTKSLTTLLLAKMVDEKKLTWDQPVTTLYPDFKLGDAETTKKVLVSHLICACTGLPRQDLEFLFQFEKQTPKGSMELLGTMQPTSKFGETFQYSNILASAAGFVAGYALFPEKELGAAYDEAMQSRVFGPLGMTETTFDWAKVMKSNHAMGTGLDVDGKPSDVVMALNHSIAPHRPAGGAWSSVHDLAKYVSMELAKGLLPDGKRYISEESLLARRKPNVKVGEFAEYGMGLFIDHEYGVDVVHHGGALIGYHSDMFWIPEANVGGVILGNGDTYLVRKAFIRKVLEVLYDGSPEADEDVVAVVASHKADLADERKRFTLPADPAIAQKLAKHYENAALGDVDVHTDPKGTTFDFGGGWKSPMSSRTNTDGTVSMLTAATGAAGIDFVLGEKDGKKTLTLRDAQHEYVFIETTVAAKKK